MQEILRPFCRICRGRWAQRAVFACGLSAFADAPTSRHKSRRFSASRAQTPRASSACAVCWWRTRTACNCSGRKRKCVSVAVLFSRGEKSTKRLFVGWLEKYVFRAGVLEQRPLHCIKTMSLFAMSWSPNACEHDAEVNLSNGWKWFRVKRH